MVQTLLHPHSSAAYPLPCGPGCTATASISISESDLSGAASHGQILRMWLLVKVLMCLYDHRYVPSVTVLLHVVHSGRQSNICGRQRNVPRVARPLREMGECAGYRTGIWENLVAFFFSLKHILGEQDLWE